MKIKLLNGVLIEGTPQPPGTVVDVSNNDAASLIRRGMAEQAEDGPAPTEATFLDATAEAPEPKRKARR